MSDPATPITDRPVAVGDRFTEVGSPPHCIPIRSGTVTRVGFGNVCVTSDNGKSTFLRTNADGTLSDRNPSGWSRK